MILRSSILAQGISCGPLAVINIGTGYLNQPNWLLAGYSVYHRVASQGFPARNVYDRPAIWAPATVQYCDRACIYDFFLVRYIVTGCIFFVHRAVCDRVRFSTPSGTPPPRPHESRVPPPPLPGSASGAEDGPTASRRRPSPKFGPSYAHNQTTSTPH